MTVAGSLRCVYARGNAIRVRNQVYQATKVSANLAGEYRDQYWLTVLNPPGAEGWDLVSRTYSGANARSETVFYLRRQTDEPAARPQT
jgi:hypothetical protein